MNLLYATDGSSDALAAAEILIRLGEGADNRLTLVCVAHGPIGSPSGRFDNEDWRQFLGDKETRAAHQIVEAAAERLSPYFPELEKRVYFGHPAETILTAAEVQEADLIVVGSQGHSALKNWFLGSVSQAVLEKAACSVLVGRALEGPLTKVLLAFDGSSESTAGLEWMGRLPQHPGLKVAVAGITEPTPSPATGPLMGWPVGFEEFYEQVAELQRKTLLGQTETAVERLRERGIPASSHLGCGDAATEIARLAKELESDLVVIGAHSRQGWIRDLLGNTTRGVIQKTACSVLVARSTRASITENTEQDQTGEGTSLWRELEAKAG